jgi:hypothetical protein
MSDDELNKILQWISPLESHKRHDDISTRRLEHTGMWFLRRAEFESWRTGDSNGPGGFYNPILACYGIPGAGKSIMRYITKYK